MLTVIVEGWMLKHAQHDAEKGIINP